MSGKPGVRIVGGVGEKEKQRAEEESEGRVNLSGRKRGGREEGRVGPAREGNGGKERRNWMK